MTRGRSKRYHRNESLAARSEAAKPKSRLRAPLGFALLVSALGFGAMSANSAITPINIVPASQLRKNGIVDCTEALIRKKNPGIVRSDPNIGGLICFNKYLSWFDDRRPDLDDEDEEPPARGVPIWVLQHVVKSDEKIEKYGRPSRWFTALNLVDEENPAAPTDNSYRFSQRFREQNSDWYQRGHLAAKYLAERAPEDPLLALNKTPKRAGPAWYTHNLVNAVPQRRRFNGNAWKTLECYTGAWANKYEEVWVVSGPIFLHGAPMQWLTSDKYKKAMPVAIPEALFKVVLRKRRPASGGGYEALAFVYLQEDHRYAKGPWNPKNWLTSVAQIEKLSGIEILPDNAGGIDKAIMPQDVWPIVKKDFDPGCKNQAPKKD